MTGTQRRSESGCNDFNTPVQKPRNYSTSGIRKNTQQFHLKGFSAALHTETKSWTCFTQLNFFKNNICCDRVIAENNPNDQF